MRGPRGGWQRRAVRLAGAVGPAALVAVVVVLLLQSAAQPYADARGARLWRAGLPAGAYPYAAQADPWAVDPWGFRQRTCTSYAAWYLNAHGVPFAARTRGPGGVGRFHDAGDWAAAAGSAGFAVSAIPAVGAIAEWDPRETSPVSPADPPGYYTDLPITARPLGHVGVVLRVHADGVVLVAQYDGATRRFGLALTRAPRYLYIGVPAPPSAVASARPAAPVAPSERRIGCAPWTCSTSPARWPWSPAAPGASG